MKCPCGVEYHYPSILGLCRLCLTYLGYLKWSKR